MRKLIPASQGSNHIVQSSGRTTEYKEAPSPVTHSTAPARHPALKLQSKVHVLAARGKGTASASVETVQKQEEMV